MTLEIDYFVSFIPSMAYWDRRGTSTKTKEKSRSVKNHDYLDQSTSLFRDIKRIGKFYADQ